MFTEQNWYDYRYLLLIMGIIIKKPVFIGIF
jgi:hypothetical protein